MSQLSTPKQTHFDPDILSVDGLESQNNTKGIIMSEHSEIDTASISIKHSLISPGRSLAAFEHDDDIQCAQIGPSANPTPAQMNEASVL